MSAQTTSRRLTPSWKRLVTPVAYLWIRHEKKISFDLYWPMGLTVVTMVVFWLLPVHPVMLGDKGFIKGVRELIGLFAAFYVVALAAVATFSRESLDQPMEGTPPRLGGRNLTRRQFVCYLFGYLAFLAFCLFIAVVAAEIITPSLRIMLGGTVYWGVKATCGSMFALGFWNMFVTTLLGIYFLVERVHINSGRNGGTAVGSDGARILPKKRAA